MSEHTKVGIPIQCRHFYAEGSLRLDPESGPARDPLFLWQRLNPFGLNLRACITLFLLINGSYHQRVHHPLNSVPLPPILYLPAPSAVRLLRSRSPGTLICLEYRGDFSNEILVKIVS